MTSSAGRPVRTILADDDLALTAAVRRVLRRDIVRSACDDDHRGSHDDGIVADDPAAYVGCVSVGKTVDNGWYRMQPCTSVERFLATPLHSYLSGPTYLVWCSAPNLGGTIVWGEPNENDVRMVTRAWEFDRTVAPGFCSLVDFSKLRRVEPSAFAAVMEFGRQRVASFDPAMKRQMAVVYPRGVLGAIVAGIFPLLEPRHRWRLFPTEAAALEWIGCDDPEGLRAQLDDIITRVMNLPPVVRRLRDWLSEHVVTANVDDAARALGHSRRSLQRALELAGSGFREELERTRLGEAARLLQETDLKVETIACRVGYSHAQLTRIVRRALGKTPAELRRRIPDPQDPNPQTPSQEARK